MRSPWHPWTPRVSRFLKRIHPRLDMTDSSLAAYLQERSEVPLDRSFLAHVRAGREGARLELLFALLEHAAEDERQLILSELAAPFGYRVVPADGGPDQTGVVTLVLRLGGLGGQVAEWLRSALADNGRIDRDEWEAAKRLAETLIQAGERLRAMAEREAA